MEYYVDTEESLILKIFLLPLANVHMTHDHCKPWWYYYKNDPFGWCPGLDTVLRSSRVSSGGVWGNSGVCCRNLISPPRWQCKRSRWWTGNTPETRGTAYVVYEDIFDAKNACDHLSGFNVCNRYLVVLYYNANRVSISHSPYGMGSPC